MFSHSSGYVLFLEDAIPLHKSWFEKLITEIQFPDTRPIIVQGVQVREPRDVAFYSDTGVHPIIYSRIQRVGSFWTPTLRLMKDYLQSRFCSKPFLPRDPLNPKLNCVLVNRYLSGKDSMGEHSDCEFFLGSDPFIITVSLGQTRQLLWRKKTKQLYVNRLVAKIPMKNASIMVMLGKSIQQCFSHEVPKCKHSFGVRWSFSFRHHIHNS